MLRRSGGSDSGTTAVAAMRAGRRFIGIELQKKWFDVSAARVRAVLAQGQSELFAGVA